MLFYFIGVMFYVVFIVNDFDWKYFEVLVEDLIKYVFKVFWFDLFNEVLF